MSLSPVYVMTGNASRVLNALRTVLPLFGVRVLSWSNGNSAQHPLLLDAAALPPKTRWTSPISTIVPAEVPSELRRRFPVLNPLLLFSPSLHASLMNPSARQRLAENGVLLSGDLTSTLTRLSSRPPDPLSERELRSLVQPALERRISFVLHELPKKDLAIEVKRAMAEECLRQYGCNVTTSQKGLKTVDGITRILQDLRNAMNDSPRTR